VGKFYSTAFLSVVVVVVTAEAGRSPAEAPVALRNIRRRTRDVAKTAKPRSRLKKLTIL